MRVGLFDLLRASGASVPAMRRHLAPATLWILLTTLGAAGAVACGGPGGPPPPRVNAPVAPASNDPAFVVSGLRRWYVVGNAATPGDAEVFFAVTAPAEVEYVDWWVAGQPGRRMVAQDGQFLEALALSELPVGVHEVLLAADGAATAFARAEIRVSHPYYVLMSTDWDFADPSDQALRRQDNLHSQHPELKLTHFAAPYTFTDPALTEPRKEELAAWLRAQRDDFGDEIGLHIHPYCHFVVFAGLTCVTDQSTVYTTDPSGYTVKNSAYDEDQFATLLAAADGLFLERGLGKPTTYRAGGWTASIETLRALARQGFVADTSALNWARLEEWVGQGTGELYRWNMATWAPIGDTSQPYYPSMTDALASTAPTLSLLEVPDNGIMVDYVSVEEMQDIFAANWDGAPLAAPRTLMMGFHPADGFGPAEHARVDGILDHADQFLAVRDAGPVVYATLNQMPLVFARP